MKPIPLIIYTYAPVYKGGVGGDEHATGIEWYKYVYDIYNDLIISNRLTDGFRKEVYDDCLYFDVVREHHDQSENGDHLWNNEIQLLHTESGWP